MAWNVCFSAVIFFILMGFTTSSVIPDAIFESHGSTSRTLLQAKKPCPVNFENQNYTIITSKCKGPQYPAKLCCEAFLEFACPFLDDLEDMTNDCGTTMFSYINLYGKYPPGLFANECHGDKDGLQCPSPPPAASKNHGSVSKTFSPVLLILTTSLLLLLLQMF